MSLRRLRPVPFYGGMVDAEDVLVEMVGATRHDVTLRPGSAAERLHPRGGAGRVLSLSRLGNPFVLEPRPDAARPADLLVIIANDLHDLAIATNVADWHRLGDVVMVCIAEVSERHLKLYVDVMGRLAKHADHVFLGTSIVPHEQFARGRVATVASILPLADVLRFPNRPHDERPIDVLHFGRRDPAQHAVLRTWAQRSGGFYLHDSGSLREVWDLQDHRTKFVNVATRSRVIVTNRARFDEERHTGGKRIFGARFVEAAAAGAVLCGERPIIDDPASACVADALPIIDFDIGADALPCALQELLDDPARSDELGRRSRNMALRCLDIAHTWEHMMQTAVLPVHAGVGDRQARLLAEIH